jgi:Carboxypeptidase regulatory-like domain
MKISLVAGGAILFALVEAHGQTACRGTAITGIVRDSTMAVIPNAQLRLDDGSSKASGGDGKFAFPCVAGGTHRLTVASEGFADRALTFTAPHGQALDVVMSLATVQTQIEVSAMETAPVTANESGPTQEISGARLQSLADDPDDLQQQLQRLAAAGGGNPSSTTIAVDGFQGSSTLPPKSSIAYIRVNPDQFSAEYREPPIQGGRVEVYTKPGQNTYHGALFLTNGSPWENARDPFSVSKASIGRQRYGFELSGPLRKTGSDFAVTTEHRSIDNFAVVNAFTGFDAGGNALHTVASVATPQRLWVGTARLDWQLGAKNTVLASYSANVNHLVNLGVGGVSLQENGFDAQKYEHVIRFSDVTTASAHLMHEARVSFRWDGETDTPNSIGPQVQVSGGFTGGGAAIGAQRLREFQIEADDDAIWTTKNHTIKAGTQFFIFNEHRRLTTNFNGTYIFGSLQDYAAGRPTAFTNVAGTPDVAFTTIRDSLFVQDDWKLPHGIQVSAGLRFFVQNHPTTYGSITPRLGIVWSPTKNGTWTLHAHAGMFAGQYSANDYGEMLRQDGIHRTASIVYNPVYGDPFTRATPIHTVRQYAPGISNLSWSAENIGGTRKLPHGFTVSVDYYAGRLWNDLRSNNINAPLNGDPFGPRPGTANLNILQLQNSGQGRVNVQFLGISQDAMKRVQFFVGAVRIDLVDNTDDQEFFTPQNPYSDAGEFAHRSGQNEFQFFGNFTLKLPEKVEVSGNLDGGADGHYNVTTGFDNNGDGNFNDRPQYAAPGTPGAVETPFGLLVASGGTGVFPRNAGIMPTKVYLDMNVQRVLSLSRNPKSEHKQTLTVNVRSSNVLNHMNVTGVGGVLGSPLFGRAYAADNGRRVEAGLRYGF